MIDTALLRDCRELATDVAPELSSHPLYIVDASIFSHLPPLHGGGCVFGWAIRGNGYCDFNIRAAIGESWQGNGNVIALCGDAIQEAAVNADAFRGCVLNVLLHELAHLLPARYIPLDDCASLFDCDEIRQYQLAKRAEAEALPELPIDSKDNPHNSAFVRRCVHLWSRSSLAGWSIPSCNLFGGDLFFTSQTPHYLTALFPELVAMRSANFTTIEDNEPTAEFVEMWQGDLANYLKYQPERKESKL